METFCPEATPADHQVSEPAILYFGTPVAIVSTVDDDRAANLAPMSSLWWLGWRCVLGLDASSHTVGNLRRTGECVINLPSQDMASVVDGIARTTGSDPVPPHKRRRGYRHEPDKFAAAGVAPQPSETVAPPRVAQCPVQLEAVVEDIHALGRRHSDVAGRHLMVETRVQRVHVDPTILTDDDPDRIDPDRWRPLILSFQHFYGLTPTEVGPSSLAKIPEAMYRGPDRDRSRLSG